MLRVTHDNHAITASSDDHLCGTAVRSNSRGKRMRILQLDARLNSGLFVVHFVIGVRREVLVGFQDVVVAADEIVLSKLIAENYIASNVYFAHERLDERLRNRLQTVPIHFSRQRIALNQIV